MSIIILNKVHVQADLIAISSYENSKIYLKMKKKLVCYKHTYQHVASIIIPWYAIAIAFYQP